MPSLPGLDAEVFFGDTETPLPDWREVLPVDESDDDELTPEDREAVIGLIGFDPAEVEKEEKTDVPQVKPSPFRKQKSLIGYFVKGGYTGSKKDKLGRTICYNQGKRTTCPKKEEAPKAKPEKKPQEVETEARQAWTEQDKTALAKVAEKIKTSGTIRGGLGVAGLHSIAKTIGLKGSAKFKKAGLVQAIYDHLTASAKHDPAKDAKDRIERIQMVEKGTGIAFKDRLINSIVAYSPAIFKEPKYREALADVSSNGDDAKAENLSYLKAIRKKVLADLKEGQVGKQQLESALRDIAEAGYGNIKADEISDYLEGLVIARAEQKTKKQKEGEIVPDNLTLAPTPKSGWKKPARQERSEDYVDRMRAPLSSRLEQVKRREMQTKVPFSSWVLNQVIGNASEADLPGKKAYQDLASRVGQGIRVSADAENKMKGFRRMVLSKLKQGAIESERVSDALETLDRDGYGTLKHDEFMNILKKYNSDTDNI